MNNTTLIYNGFISEEDAMHIKRSEYEYWLEADIALRLHPWDETNLPKYPKTVEDCMGNEYRTESVQYMIVGRKFYGFASKEEKDLVIKSFPTHIVNADPFMVAF